MSQTFIIPMLDKTVQDTRLWVNWTPLRECIKAMKWIGLIFQKLLKSTRSFDGLRQVSGQLALAASAGPEDDDGGRVEDALEGAGSKKEAGIAGVGGADGGHGLQDPLAIQVHDADSDWLAALSLIFSQSLA
jgi:hypothetical protein